MKRIIFFLMLKFMSCLIIFSSLHATGDIEVCAIAIDACTERDELKATKQVFANSLHYQSGLGATLAFCCYALRSVTHLENPAALEIPLFKTLEQISLDQEIIPAYYEGKKLPPLLSAHLAGLISEHDARQRAMSHIDQTATITDKTIFKSVTELLFTPEQAVLAIKPRPGTLELFGQLKAQNPAIPLILTLNFSSLEPIKKGPHSKIFALFKDQKSDTMQAICSGDAKTIKSSSSFYEKMGIQFHLDPATTLLIESEAAHIAAAKQAGFTRSILWTDAAQVKTELQKLNLL